MILEKAPPGKKFEKLILKLKKRYGEDSPKPFQTAWAIYNKSKKESVAAKGTDDSFSASGLWDQLLAEKTNQKQKEMKLSDFLFESEEEDPSIKETKSFQDIVENMSLKEIYEYATANFKKLGEGEGRIVFDLDNGKVVKIARDRTGINQNKNEYLTYEALSSNDIEDIVPEVHWSDHKYRYLVSEFAAPISESEFGSKTGIPWELYEYELEDLRRAYERNLFDPDQDNTLNLSDLSSGESFSSRDEYEEWRTNEDGNLVTNEEDNIKEVTDFEKKILNAMSHGDLLIGDLLRIDQYGLTNDGRVVLLDTGFTWRTKQ